MLAKKYREMLSAKSVIRSLSEYAAKRGRQIGYENVFDYSLGNPSVDVPQSYTDTLIDMLSNENPAALHGYSPTLTIPAVREAVAENLNRRFGMNYQKEHIFMVSGAAGAIAHAVRLVAEPGDEIITFAPFFPEYQPYVDLSGAILKVVPARTEDFQIPFEALDAVMSHQTAAVLINTPNNPSGVVYSEETLRQLSSFLHKKEEAYGHEIYLISDEPYREIAFDNQTVPYPANYYEHTITCYSWSKSLSIPGDRIGYVAVHPDCPDAELMIQMCGQISRGIGHNCPTAMVQLAVAQNLDCTADLSVYEANRNLLYEELIKLGFTVVRPAGTFYIFPKALEEDAVLFCEKAKKYDLILVPGDSFGCPGYFRMAYCIDTEKVKRSLPALERFVQEEYRR